MKKLGLSFFLSLFIVFITNLAGSFLVRMAYPNMSLPWSFYAVFLPAETLICFGFFYIAKIWTFSLSRLRKELELLARIKV